VTDQRRWSRCFLLIFFLSLSLASCFVPVDKSNYQQPKELEFAPVQRQEFIDAFLQGKWCEARYLFGASVEKYLRQDDFCQVSKNYVLAWKLKRYAGDDDQALIDKARYYHRLAFNCKDLQLASLSKNVPETGYSQRDALYRKLLEKNEFKALLSALKGEEDHLYASVYGRKSALAAIAAKKPPFARGLVEQTRALDARQGWIVFLREDWRILHQLAPDHQKEIIAERINALGKLIQPCAIP